MKRRIKKENILILVLSLMVIVLAILLMISVSKNKKKENACSVEEKNKLENKTEIVCGDDNDIARFMCARFHEDGYIITFKETVDDNTGYGIMNELMSSVNGAPIMYVSKNEINNILRNIYSVPEEKDYGVDSFIYIVKNNSDYKKIESAVKSNNKLDKIIEYKTSNK